MSGTIRVIDLPDLGAVTDAASIVADKTGTGRFSALALKSYCATTTLPEAPSNNVSYGRLNGAWSPVVPDAPSNSATYGRMNATWVTTVPEAPLTGVTYGRMNGAWTGVLPITGGAISGNLSASGTITSGAGVYANAFSLSSANSYEWALYIQGGTGDHFEQHRAGWVDVWRSSDGARYWASPSGNQMVLDAAGDLTATGYVMAPQFWVSSGGVGQFGLTPGAGGRILQFSSSFYLEFVTATATLQWNVSSGPLWVMRASDDFCFNPQSNVGGNGAYLNISDRRAKTGIVPTTKGLAEIMQLQPVEFDRQNPATGTVHEIGFIAQDVQPIVPEAVWQAGIPLQDGSGGLDSGEPTLAMSESTITALNVNAIKELNTLITALTDRIAALEAPGSGGLDSGEPTLAMSESTITALNVNAIKELNAFLRVYKNMRQRVENPNNKQFKDYGGRGIVICERWQSFLNFRDDMYATWKPTLMLDRIDNNGPYSPENCRWATRQQQMANRRRGGLWAVGLEPIKTNTSGMVGAHFAKKQGKWISQISINRKHHWLGTFDTKEEAAEAYRLARASASSANV